MCVFSGGARLSRFRVTAPTIQGKFALRAVASRRIMVMWSEPETMHVPSYGLLCGRLSLGYQFKYYSPGPGCLWVY